MESPERVTEGDSVRLTCKSSCTLTDRATFIWYRNSQPLTERRDRNNELLLQSVRREDAGRYSCAVHGHNHISPAVQLNVTYPPVNPVISISPSGEIVSGDSVTLICSSDSNPPALNFSWFKGGTFVGSGRIFNISKISSDDSGEYKCRSINEHGEKYSDTVTLNVMYPPRSVSVSISPSGEIVSGDSVTLICSSDSNPPALNFSWFKGGTFVGSGRIFNISKISSDDSGEYKCRSINEHGEKYSDTVTLNVMYPPRSVSVSISPSGEIVSGDSVTLICSSDSNPPALNFSWFKGGTFVGSGRIFSISKISSDDSGEYKCRSINEHGEKYSDAVTLIIISVRCFSSVAVAVGVLLGGASGAFVMYICLSRRMKRRSAVKEISDPDEDTYTVLELKSTTSDPYDTLTTVHPRAPEDSCRTLDPQSFSKHENPSVSVFLVLVGIKKVFWTKVFIRGNNKNKGIDPPDLSNDIEYSQRLQYLGDKQQNCTIRLSHVTLKDSHMYYFRFITDKDKWTGKTGVTLSVTDPPRNVSIIQSGQIWAGDSVSLICSSDSNPPALNFSWFKENESSAVGSGQSFSALQSGRFYCQAHNQHGSQRSDAVTVTVHHGAGRNVIVIAATSGGLFFIIIIIIM
ncbi:B-cell receptor CD22-like [Megalobrama amblycephala]|uniref:B-cell receptor CD22-like n=1 Tax=Megalobrama amblycephala TaxID=75352 RepID=UPI002013F09A|nr:B-cell receptor CD22-like [Megalobrama amblycephala]